MGSFLYDTVFKSFSSTVNIYVYFNIHDSRGLLHAALPSSMPEGLDVAVYL
jgi:hypothetical protein